MGQMLQGGKSVGVMLSVWLRRISLGRSVSTSDALRILLRLSLYFGKLLGQSCLTAVPLMKL